MPTIRGYGAVFHRFGDPGTEYVFHDSNVIERIHPKAFKRTLAEKTDVLALWNHEPDLILGRSSTGTLALSTDHIGLRFIIDLPNTNCGRSVAELVDRQDLDGSSFSFLPVDVQWTEENGKAIRTILDADLLDVGPVTFPAYSGTSVEIGGTIKMAGFRRCRPTPWTDGLKEACSGDRKLIVACLLDAKVLERKADDLDFCYRLAERRRDDGAIDRLEKKWRRVKRSMRILGKVMETL